MTIDQARSTVREFCSHWTTEKVSSVLAFCEAGKMSFWSHCSCLIGVHSSAVPHTECFERHYAEARWPGTEGWWQWTPWNEDRRMEAAEVAYGALGNDGDRDQEFAGILREILAERADRNKIGSVDAATATMNSWNATDANLRLEFMLHAANAADAADMIEVTR